MNASSSLMGNRSDGLAAHVPDGALCPDRLRVRHQAEHADGSGDARLVDAFEAAPDHVRRRAVAERVRDAELEGHAVALAQWVRWTHVQCSEVEMVARCERQLAEQIAPVGGKKR